MKAPDDGAVERGQDGDGVDGRAESQRRPGICQ